MALKLFLEQAPEGALATEYKKVEIDGKTLYQLDVDTAGTTYTVEDTAGLRSALSKEREALKKLQKDVKAFEGLDPAAARDALKKLEDLGDISQLSDKDKVEQRINSVRKQLEEKFTGEKGVMEKALGRYRTELEKAMVVARAESAIRQAGGDDSTVQLLLPTVTKSAKLVEEGEAFQVHIAGDDGNPLITRKGGTANMDFSEYVESIKPKHARAFPAKGATGSGATGNGAGGPSDDLSKLPPVDRLKAARSQQRAQANQ